MCNASGVNFPKIQLEHGNQDAVTKESLLDDLNYFEVTYNTPVFQYMYGTQKFQISDSA